ncbi:MAG TPA: putative Ig domain-containing protein, partial [Thermoanaerobaculia bacterium]|nr:putative Ig domain-containing protein [Thermoanaerobaculia bacterium]
MRPHLKVSVIPLVLFFIFTLLTAVATSAASPIRYGKISWCFAPYYPNYEPVYIAFEVELAYAYTGQSVGDTVTETLHYDGGATTPVVLTVTEVQPAQGWVRAVGNVRPLVSMPHTYAWLDTCCRDGDLNNRSGENFTVSSLVNIWAEWSCSPETGVPPIVWLAGGLGDTFQIPIPYRRGTDSAEPLCSLTGDGLNPDGMTIDPDRCVITWTPTTGDPSKLWTAQVEVGDSFGSVPYTSTGLDFLLGLDDAKPTCLLQSVDPGPPTHLEVFIQDSRSGVASVQVLESANTSVNIPSFLPGTTGELTVVGTKIDQSRSARLRLRVTDLAGNATECDPILTEETRETGAPQTSTHTGIPPEEHVVTVYNGDPGLQSLDIDVNGRKFKMNGLRTGEERTLDVAAAMPAAGMSTITLTTRSKPGG